MILYRPGDLNSDSKSNSNYNSTIELKNSSNNRSKTSSKESKKSSNGLRWDVNDSKNRVEILLRYQQTPTVISSRTFLVYSQPRTPGMCSVLDFWP